MKRGIGRIITVCGFIIFIVWASNIAIGIQFIASANPSPPIILTVQEDYDMLIFVSPQYANDPDIYDSIITYIISVKNDIGWNSKIITITKEVNDYRIIDGIIEKYYVFYDIKACIFVGEDTNTPLAGDCNYMEKPSIVPWFTTGGKEAYESTQQGIISKPYKIDICISLLYPTHEQDYNSKKLQIINAFEKFSNKRHTEYCREITVFESSDINTNSKRIYQDIKNHVNLNYIEDSTKSNMEKSLNENNSMYFIHGHSNPSGTYINGNSKIWFSADYLDNLKTPFFGADGCYVSGWWSNQKDNNNLDQSISATWYASKIFTSKHIKTMVLGLLSQNGYSFNVSFIENAIPKLTRGNTLAESMIGSYFTGDFIITGDPTIYFN